MRRPREEAPDPSIPVPGQTGFEDVPDGFLVGYIRERPYFGVLSVLNLAQTSIRYRELLGRDAFWESLFRAKFGQKTLEQAESYLKAQDVPHYANGHYAMLIMTQRIFDLTPEESATEFWNMGQLSLVRSFRGRFKSGATFSLRIDVVPGVVRAARGTALFVLHAANPTTSINQSIRGIHNALRKTFKASDVTETTTVRGFFNKKWLLDFSLYTTAQQWFAFLYLMLRDSNLTWMRPEMQYNGAECILCMEPALFKCGSCLMDAYCSEACADFHWATTHFRNCAASKDFAH